MIRCTFVWRIHVEFDGSGVFVAVSSEIIAVFVIFLIVVEEKIA